jgi:hypothetical protein
LKNLKLDFDIKVQPEIPKSTYAIFFDFNEYHLDYHSNTSLKTGLWEGWCKIS